MTTFYFVRHGDGAGNDLTKGNDGFEGAGNIMNRNKALSLYLLGTLGQIWIICIIVFMLRRNGLTVDYTTSLGMAAVGVGGISSALWGSVIAVKYKNYKVKKY